MIMSEIKKNIETCRGEDVLAEVSAAPQDPHFGSLVNEALDPLKQQALHQAGYDGYSEVIAQHKPYTFASAIIQMKSNLLLLLRALWQFPFGTGTLRSLSDDASLRSLSDDASLRSLSDMWQHYITRLSGNSEYGIPSRLSSLTDLPSAPLLVADRKISGADVADGMSLVHLTCEAARAAEITTLTDDNYGWVMDKQFSNAIAPDVKNLTIGAGTSTAFRLVSGLAELEELTFSNLKSHTNVTSGDADGGWQGGIAQNCPKLKKINMPDTETINATRQNFETSLLFAMNPLLEELNAPKIKSIAGTARTDAYNVFMFNGCPLMKKIVLGAVTRWDPNCIRYAVSNAAYSEIKTFDYLEHLEFGEGTAISLNLAYWNPTNALDASLDTLVTDEDCHNNLEQFLKNFRTYIALRLADNGSGKTLTLSQAVYDAIKDESHLFVFDEGTMTIYAYLTNIKHWTVTK